MTKKKPRFLFIDQFRGLIGVMMLLGHCNYFLNSVWHSLDPLDPFFATFGQFSLRYMGYLCAPGFLFMNGAMTWYSYQRRRKAGQGDRQAKWHLLQRGLFLVLVQITWVNSSWGGFSSFKPEHFGIIATIGLAMCCLALLANTRWQIRLAAALAAFLIHPLLLKIPYNADSWQIYPMQLLVAAGDFTKYPLIPWFGLGAMGSVLATGWLEIWKTPKKRITMTLIIGFAALAIATAIRLSRGYGNIFPFSEFFQYSFFLDQKYPPSLYHNIWFTGAVCIMMSLIMILGEIIPRLTAWLGIVGRVPLFFYAVHIGILGVFVKRMDFHYREYAVLGSFVGLAVMLVVMLPLAYWFGGVKRRSKNYLIQMI
ncbi:MAG: DUF1624 domain-containing protein [Candidatus Eisenbacteria bacterium]|uniref:DUF1624 domain-containing protein n=1 Tax=Eiseniibacteriota bacterium TaxID=2212470 RepID=A0A948WE06_UNCEI|nr:DUF1624 domain-containing protein [Candidatus Eisenbacteria bacterium]MBU2692333.1 DUF1624 domain-containing protein [Candidatus Eisenbacteria bacterium]